MVKHLFSLSKPISAPLQAFGTWSVAFSRSGVDSLTHVPASINVDSLTVDVAVRGQEQDGVSDFLGSSEATYWHKSGLDAAVVANHIGLYERWSDRVGGDALLGQ